MKNIIILTTFSLALLVTSASAADPNVKRITASNRQIEQKDDVVYVQFDVAVGKRAARSGHTVIYRPYLENGAYRWDLPEVVVQKKRADIARQRHEWKSAEETVYENPVFARGGDKFRYSAAVPRQGWMKGANLEAEIIDMGCCSSDMSGSDMIAENIDLPTPMGVIVIEPSPEDIAAAESVPAPKTTGDRLSEDRPFVMHASQFEITTPALMFDDDRESALKVQFAVNSSRLDPAIDNNANTLRLLLESIKKLT